MSLVSEALRKARQEAAAREAVRRTGVAAPGLVAPPARRGLALHPLLLAALVLAAGLAGALGAWLVLGRGPEATGTGHPAGAPGSVPTPALPAREVRAGLVVAADPGPPSPPTVTHAPTSSRATPVAATHVPVASSLVAGRPGEPPPAPPAGAAPAAPAGAADRTFVLDADLGRVKLHLDFVVYKPSAPFAAINGIQVVPGSIVEGLVVEEIGRGFVRLRDGQGTVTLKAR